METPVPDPFGPWFAALERRHLADLTFQEVRRALQALSSLYVNRRKGLQAGGALDGAGKRAAFAIFYGPLHFLLVREVVRALDAAAPAPAQVVDLGCGTGPAGAAWALEAGRRPQVTGIDRNGWAVGEANWAYTTLGLRGHARREEIDRTDLPGRGGAVLAAFTVNEVAPATRDRLLPRLVAAAGRGARVLVIEPIARRAAPWWEDWSAAFVAAGGRNDAWRFEVDLPERLRLFDRAAGLEHRELTGRSLYLSGR
ncbi:MAG TPA: class I SAM-dependent methyltransferase [Candidatus Polarisedimenticolia bacterium]|nr:class I SAM-dependent methyltransferase [Candidatus Polarisedimenticolia bacterium]